MNVREFLIARRQAEWPAFRKVLDAMPADRWSYTPHDRSPSAGSIAWTLAVETRACCELVRRGFVDWAPEPAPSDASQVTDLVERAYEELSALVADLDDAAWGRPAQLRAGGKTMLELPLGEFLWFFFFDAIHHRGQLSTYIRPMGGRVPAIYGPSADDPGPAAQASNG